MDEMVVCVDLGHGAVLRVARAGWNATLDVFTVEEKNMEGYKPASAVHLDFHGSARLVELRDTIDALVRGMQKHEAANTF